MNEELSSKERYELILQRAKEDLLSFGMAVEPEFESAWHLDVIANELMRIERDGDKHYKVLLIYCPPRHGKSTLSTVLFPIWYLGRNPTKEIITVSYSAELAQEFGGLAREYVADEPYKAIFNVSLREDAQAKAKWKTDKGGSYTSVGVGGTVTGRGANVLIFDDPIKNRKEAESEVYRDSVWQFFKSGGFTRLEPHGVAVVILCMTGDTPVLMADGTERLLKDIRIGDSVATFDNGKLSVSTVKNWANNGRDNILKITTISGRIVRANGRHPFLIYDKGKLKWRQAKNLHIAQQIVTLKDKRVNGKTKNVFGRNVISQPFVGDTVCNTTQRKNGLMVIEPLHTITNPVFRENSNIVMELLFKSTNFLLKNKEDYALSVKNHREKMSGHIGEENCALTTTTKRGKSGLFSVMIAISRLVMQKLKLLPLLLRSTSDFTLEDIVSIEDDGIEEVFDIQVEKTENFIANGVVSHNTRWHVDDLAGRILLNEGLKDKTKIIHFPAIATMDEEFRKAGEALWPKRWNLEYFEEVIKPTEGPYDWEALYQGSPILTESQEFRPEWFKYVDETELDNKKTKNILTVDTAISKRASADWTGFCDNSIDEGNFWNIKAWHQRLNPDELIENLFALHQRRRYAVIGIEKTTFTEGLKPYLEAEQRRRGKYLPIQELEHKQRAKEIRIRGLIPRYSSGSIRHVKGYCSALELEMAQFPNGLHDDILDALAYQTQVAPKRQVYPQISMPRRRQNIAV